MTENQEMEKRLVSLEKQLKTLLDCMAKKEETNQELHYHIKHLEIREAHIDKLNYHLDNVDVDQLYGTLNIGNNFEADSNKSSLENEHISPLKNLVQEKTRKNAYPKRKKASESNGITLAEQKRGYSIIFDQRGKGE